MLSYECCSELFNPKALRLHDLSSPDLELLASCYARGYSTFSDSIGVSFMDAFTRVRCIGE